MKGKQRTLVDQALIEFALCILICGLLSGIFFGIDSATTERFSRTPTITWAPVASAVTAIIGFSLTLAHIFRAHIKRFGAGRSKTTMKIFLLIILIVGLCMLAFGVIGLLLS